MNVLLVTADREFAAHVAETLPEKRDELAVTTETSRADARERVATTDFDCVACDHGEGQLDALALLQEIRAEDSDVPVVLLADADDYEVATTAFERGATDVLPRDESDAWVSMFASRVEQGATERASSFGKRTEATLERLNEVTRELIEAETTDEVAQVVNEYASEVLDFPATSVRRYDPDRHALEVIRIGETVGDIEERPPYPVDDSPHGKAFRRGDTVVDDLRGVEDDPYDRDVFSQAMYVPIGEYGTISIGIMSGTFTDLDVRFAEILANNARVAFDEATRNEQLSAALSEVEAFADRVVTASDSLAGAAEDVRVANDEIVDAVDDISDGAGEQSDYLREVNAEMNDLLATVEQVTASADEVASQSQRSADLAREGHQRAREGIESMDGIETQVDELVGELDALRDEISNVADSVSVIDDVAEQTNILALNASIEAARVDAGGEGFAVVADEIKELATETKESTKEIQRIVDRVTTQSENVGAAMERMQSDVAAGADTVAAALTALERILDSVEETDDGIQEIHRSIDRQAATVEDVVGITERVATISRNTSEGTDTVATLVTEQSTPVEEVATHAKELERMAEDLRELAGEIADDEMAAVGAGGTQSASSD